MKKNNRFLYFIQEVAIVVIGVLIAVSIGKYKENTENEAYVEATLLAIENEIKTSRSDVDTVLNKHLALFEKLQTEAFNEEQTLAEFIASSGGFQVASVKNVSLRFFISNKAELLEFEIISQLLDIEFMSDLLKTKVSRLSDFAYDNINERSEEVKIKFSYLLSDVIDGEQTLLAAYQEFLDQNQATLKSDQ